MQLQDPTALRGGGLRGEPPTGQPPIATVITPHKYVLPAEGGDSSGLTFAAPAARGAAIAREGETADAHAAVGGGGAVVVPAAGAALPSAATRPRSLAPPAPSSSSSSSSTGLTTGFIGGRAGKLHKIFRSKQHAMLSYQWDHQEQVVALRKLLDDRHDGHTTL